MRRVTPIVALLYGLCAWTVPVAAQESFGEVRPAPLGGGSEIRPTGRVGNDLFVRGRFAGRLDPERINCLGHAAGVDASVQTGQLPLGDALRALGFECRAGEPETLAGPIARGERVMVVYFYAFLDEFRAAEDRGLSLEALLDKYDREREPWSRKDAFTYWIDQAPFDFHAMGYDHASGSWSWVTHARPKEADGSYSVDSVAGTPATLDPDFYFRPEQVVSKLACVQAS